MGITFKEFLVAMETFGAKKIHKLDVENGISLPAFLVNDVIFVHCGDYCKVLDSKNNHREKMLLNENIYSINSLIITLLNFEEKYDEKYLCTLINQTYNKLFKELKIKNKDVIHNDKNKFINLTDLYKILLRFDDLVNPYGNDTLKLKEPSKYLDRLKIRLDIKDNNKSNNQNIRISLVNGNTKIGFVTNINGWYYYASTFNDLSIGKDSGYIAISHYFNNGNDGLPIDEIVNLTYVPSKNDLSEKSYICYNYGLDLYEEVNEKLSISLGHGIFWNPDNIKDVRPVTDIQIDRMVCQLRKCICRVEEDILNYMCI